jgi:hypothetical protein
VQPTDDHPHTAFEVPAEAFDFCCRALEAAEIPYDGPTRRGPPGRASLYFLDPFGNHLEVYADSGYTGAVEDRPPEWRPDMVYTWPK